MEIKKAEFTQSSSKVGQCPNTELKEFAFIGRSNVGKSSLINMLTGRKALAKTSSSPGKTRLINHFIINDAWYMVDLPGYGYAKVSKNTRNQFGKLIRSYISQREQLFLLFVLIDVRHQPQKIDLEFMELLGEQGVPFHIIFTKSDKISSSQLKSNIKHYEEELLKDWEEVPRYFVSSSAKKRGKEEILEYIDDLLS